MRRSSSGGSRSTPSPGPADPAAAPAPPPSAAPIGNGLLVLFGIVAAIFGILSFTELRGGRAGPVFGATVVVSVLVVVLAAFYKAGRLARGASSGPGPADADPPAKE